MEKLEQLPGTVNTLMADYGIPFLKALVVLIVGLIVIRWLTKVIVKLMQRGNVNETLVPFLRTLFNFGLKTLLVISVMGMVGIEMTSFIAVLGAAGLAVGMALQGTLQNFAGGVMILLLKPYKVGDVIEATGYTGSVKEIQIFHTVLTTADNRKIIIPNSPLATTSLINYSAMPERRIDFTFGIGYGDDIDKAKNILLNLAGETKKVSQSTAPMVVVESLGDSSVNLKLRVWVKTEDYWDLWFYIHEEVKKRFDKNGISIPFPQQDVHVYHENQ